MEIEDLEKIEKPQDFEILYEMSDQVHERMTLIDFIEDFEPLENIFISDEDKRVQMKAFDRLTDLFEDDKRYHKMIKMIREITGFRGWTPFDIDHLRKNNNIDGGIRWLLYENYHYYRFGSYGNELERFAFNRGHVISDVVDVFIYPIKENGKHVGHLRMHDFAWKYGLVIKVLQENDEGFYFDYILGEVYNTLNNAHDVYHDEKCFS